MLRISEHIISELKDSIVILKRLELIEKERLLNLISNKYIDSNKSGTWFWEKLIKCVVLNDDMAWSYIKDFVGENECIMFFNQNEEKEMFLIRSGEDLNYLLSETYGFEFYITDKECSYLLCFNHHDILYGCGRAEGWIDGMRKIHNEN